MQNFRIIFVLGSIPPIEMKSIAFIHRSPFPNGGAEKVTIDLTSWLINHGWRVYIIVKTIDERLPEWIRNSNRVSVIPYNSLSHKQLARFIVELSHLHEFDAIAVQGLWLRRIDIIRKKQSAFAICIT